jgi:hypothetical protein
MYRKTLLLAEVSENTDRCGSLNQGTSIADSCYPVLSRALLLAGEPGCCQVRFRTLCLLLARASACGKRMLRTQMCQKVSLLAEAFEVQASAVL